MKRFNKLAAIFIVLFSMCFLTCKYGLEEAVYRSDSVRRRAISLKEMDDSATQNMLSSLGSKYDVLLISDLHYGKSGASQHESELLDWLDTLSASKKPAFCINLGDTADHGRSDEYNSYLDFQNQLCSRLKSPVVYNIVGNHDLFNSGWSEWEEKMYPHTSFFHFETGNVSWYFLDSGSGTLGDRQMKELADALKRDSKAKIVSLHYPMYADKINMLSYFALQDEHESDLLFSLFAKNNVKLVLDGHTHRYFNNDFGKFTEFNLSSLMASTSWGILSVDETKMEFKPRKLGD